MDRFVSTFTNKIDAKGRVSIPAPFRAVLERDGYAGGGIYCYPSLDAPALDAGGQSLAQKIDGLLAGLPDYSDERDELSVALYGDVHILSLDGDGRIDLTGSAADLFTDAIAAVGRRLPGPDATREFTGTDAAGSVTVRIAASAHAESAVIADTLRRAHLVDDDR